LRDVGEQQREVVGVLQASVHSLAADWRVHMSGITGEEKRSNPESRGHAVMDTVGREPVDLAERNAQVVASGPESFVLGNGVMRCQGSEPRVPAGAEREGHGERRRAESRCHLAVRPPAGIVNFGDPERCLIGDSIKARVQITAHR